MVITPTVGRIVYYRAKLLDGVHPKESPEQAAIIVKVLTPSRVNLVVFGHNGEIVPMTGVLLVQAEDKPPHQHSYCEWMPYQKGQAAKTEELERKAGGAT